MASARGPPLAATSLTPVAVSLKSSAVKWISASSRFAACAALKLGNALSANSKATRPARHKRIVFRARRQVEAGRRYAAFPLVFTSEPMLGGATALFGGGIVVTALERHPIGLEILRAR